MILHNCTQGSLEWLRLRCGIPTASEFDRIITPTGKASTQAEGYAYRLLAEQIIGEPLENPETRWMERGTALESQAADAYAFERGVEIAEVGFITDDAHTMGASPDRLAGDDGVCELKCPAPQTHVAYLCSPALLQKTYRVQVQGELLVSRRQYADLVSYCPGLPIVVCRVERDEEYLAKMSDALAEFTKQLSLLRAYLECRYGPFVNKRKPEPTDPWDGLGITEEDVEAILNGK